MRRQILSSQNFSFGYTKFLFIQLATYLCCCIVKRYDKEVHKGNWYRRNMQKLRKIELARKRMKDELELHEIITHNRLSHFTSKLWTNRR